MSETGPEVDNAPRSPHETQMFLNTVEVSKLEELYVDPTAGRWTVASLGSHWLSSQAHVEAPSQKAHETALRVHVLHTILELAVDDKLIARNPARGIKTLPSNTHRKNEYLTFEQVERVSIAADHHHLIGHRGKYRFVIHIAAYMGLQGSEIATLGPDDADLEERRVRIRAPGVEEQSGA